MISLIAFFPFNLHIFVYKQFESGDMLTGPELMTKTRNLVSRVQLENFFKKHKDVMLGAKITRNGMEILLRKIGGPETLVTGIMPNADEILTSRNKSFLNHGLKYPDKPDEEKLLKDALQVSEEYILGSICAHLMSKEQNEMDKEEKENVKKDLKKLAGELGELVDQQNLLSLIWYDEELKASTSYEKDYLHSDRSFFDFARKAQVRWNDLSLWRDQLVNGCKDAECKNVHCKSSPNFAKKKDVAPDTIEKQPSKYRGFSKCCTTSIATPLYILFT